MLSKHYLWAALTLAVASTTWGKADAAAGIDRRARLNPPTGIVATAKSATSLEVRFTDRTLNEQGFVVEVQRDGRPWEAAARLRGREGIRRKLTALLTQLRPDTQYQVRVRAFRRNHKDGLSKVKTAKTQASLPAVILSNELVSSEAAHSSGTTLVNQGNRLVLAFREGAELFSYDGRIRVLSSTDGATWTPLALLEGAAGEDLRIPHLSVRPDGTLLLNAGVRTTDGMKDTHRSRVWTSPTGATWSAGTDVLETNVWLYSVTWRNGTAYAPAFSTDEENRFLRVYTSTDGLAWTQLAEPLTGVTFGYPSEASIAFKQDGTAVMLVRRSTVDTGQPATAVMLIAAAPYTAWFAHETDGRFASPKLVVLPDQRVVAGGRAPEPARAALAWLDDELGKLTEAATLGTSDDSGYPGIYQAPDGTLWVSYHVEQNGKTVVALAHVRFPN